MSGSLLDRKIEAEMAEGKVGWLKAVRRSRAFRTFMRDKAAVVALGVIAIYISIAVVIIGAQLANAVTRGALSDTFIVKELSLDASLKRVGPDSLPGFFNEPKPEDRLEHADSYLSRIERALSREDPAAALLAVTDAERGVADLLPDEIGSLLEDAFDALDTADITFEDVDILREDLEFAREDLAAATTADDAEELRTQIDEMTEQLVEAEAAFESALDGLDDAVLALMPWPTGFDGAVYNARLLLGTDSQGRSILWRAVYSIRVATQVGLVSAILAVVVGAFMGAPAGFFGGWVDHAIVWLYSTLSSVP